MSTSLENALAFVETRCLDASRKPLRLKSRERARARCVLLAEVCAICGVPLTPQTTTAISAAAQTYGTAFSFFISEIIPNVSGAQMNLTTLIASVSPGTRPSQRY